jgi:hypothetical protein
MPFQQGQTGNPNGARKSKRYEQALLKELAALGDGEIEAGLRKIAKLHVAEAAKGDLAAMESLANRIDGKPAQQLIHSGDSENPLHMFLSELQKSALPLADDKP